MLSTSDFSVLVLLACVKCDYFSNLICKIFVTKQSKILTKKSFLFVDSSFYYSYCNLWELKSTLCVQWIIFEFSLNFKMDWAWLPKEKCLQKSEKRHRMSSRRYHVMNLSLLLESVVPMLKKISHSWRYWRYKCLLNWYVIQHWFLTVPFTSCNNKNTI